jgi:hypothetical protein
VKHRRIAFGGMVAVVAWGLSGACGGGDGSPRDAAAGTGGAAGHPAGDAGHAGADAAAGSGPGGGPADGGAPDGQAEPDGGSVTDCPLGPGGEPTDLRCTGLYADWATKAIATGVRQYDPGLHLWSDGASKTRWIYLPPGTQIDSSNMDQWTFANGTKVWKEFDLGGARVETRLLWKRANGTWYLTTYRWSADGTTAPELTEGEMNVGGGTYQIPAQSDCSSCHAGRWDMVLGFDAIGLSTTAASGVTMATLKAENLLTAPPTSPLTIPGDAKAAAALGYLHVNCGSPCHNSDGPEAGSSTGLLMRLNAAELGAVADTDTWNTAMGVSASFAIPGVKNPEVLAPCDPTSSAAYYRMSVRDGVDGIGTQQQMPPIITHQPDPDGLAAIAAWLNDQPQCAQAAAP